MGQTKGLPPGSKAPNSGQYQERGPRGGHGPEATVPRGRPLPPTSQPGGTWDLVDPSKNNSGRGK